MSVVVLIAGIVFVVCVLLALLSMLVQGAVFLWFAIREGMWVEAVLTIMSFSLIVLAVAAAGGPSK